VFVDMRVQFWHRKDFTINHYSFGDPGSSYNVIGWLDLTRVTNVRAIVFKGLHSTAWNERC